jgi:hypothetical protein
VVTASAVVSNAITVVVVIGINDPNESDKPKKILRIIFAIPLSKISLPVCNCHFGVWRNGVAYVRSWFGYCDEFQYSVSINLVWQNRKLRSRELARKEMQLLAQSLQQSLQFKRFVKFR